MARLRFQKGGDFLGGDFPRACPEGGSHDQADHIGHESIAFEVNFPALSLFVQGNIDSFDVTNEVCGIESKVTLKLPFEIGSAYLTDLEGTYKDDVDIDKDKISFSIGAHKLLELVIRR